MQFIDAKIEFLHDARPFIPANEYENITISFPLGGIPIPGDLVFIDGVSHPKGAYVVSHRVFDAKDGLLEKLTLTLGLEGSC
jgi:hypothetical protein